MPWARLDDNFHDHPKVDGLSLSAVGLFTLCLTWAHRHRKKAIVPGHIADARVRKLAGRAADKLAGELVAAGLWETNDDVDGYLIHDFADYLPKERDPEERAEAGRKGARSRWQGHSKPDGKLPANSMANGMANDGSRASAPASPYPYPYPTTESAPEGERPETLHAVTATGPPKDSDTCTRHPNGNPTDEPCRGCQRVEERKTRRAEQAAGRAGREAEERARNCPVCEGTHFVLDEEKRPTRRRCDHRRSA